MNENPFARLVELMRRVAADPPLDLRETSADTKGTAVRLREGKVVSVEPLKVQIAGMKIPASELKINERLAKGAKWRVKIKSKTPDFRSSTSDTVEDAQVEPLELDLEEGDKVLLLTSDDQLFYLIMKVVDAK